MAEQTIADHDNTFSLHPNRLGGCYITETETIEKGSDTSSIFKGAAIGAAAAAVLSEIFGDIDFVEVLAGGGVGAVAGLLLGGRNEAEVVVINPDTDLDLTLQSDFVLN
jgi:hypothetical protein